MTGCSSSGGDEPAPPRASATHDDGQKERSVAQRRALAAYRGMWDAQVEAYSSGSMAKARLGDYTTGDAASMIINLFTYYNEHGLAFKGGPVTNPKVSAVNVGSEVDTATISDCVDMTGVVVRRATGKPIAVAKEDTRRPWTAKATTAKSGGTEWRISDYTIDKDRTC
ncbi:hypothetical protein OG782_16215 [Streptomyces sp. NBC_00876]|uniref:hypothetical protein n=1 Tax=Streptomyces sp. NBC_00876 TaxID=2975853 RepID=UPI00386BC184|nr:hypothetical protein OG782_16215 [Streptomyces sp. NBC_00876]